MVAPVAKTSRMRQRKLNLKQSLQVVREDDLESFEANEPTLKEIQTGVEAHEEQEHHLQAVISAAQAAAAGGSTAKASIPTRGTENSTLPYDSFYHLKFNQPATYIRFSSTVEDCIDGPSYDIVDEDDEFIRSLNEKLRLQAQQASSRPTSRSAAAASETIPQSCTDVQFEADMAAFEAAAKAAAPFSNSVNGDQAAPILSLDEQLARLTETLSEESSVTSSPRSMSLLRALATHIYPHWQSRRSKNENVTLTPTLKVKVLETGDALDDNDPYVCFRRREVRAVRKTRGRDAQSSEKLRTLRRQLEDARQLIQTVLVREKLRKEVLTVDKSIFEARSNLRGVKRSLPAQYQAGDEDLLVNQKPKPVPREPKRTPEQPEAPKQPAKQIHTGPEMQLLEEWYEARRRHQLAEITNKVQQHKQWNNGYIDDTTTPVKALPPDDGFVGGFRAARTEYLPTPPASSASEDIPTAFDAEDEPSNEADKDQMQVDRPPTASGTAFSPPRDTATGDETPVGLAAKSSLWPVEKTSHAQLVNVKYTSPASLRQVSSGRSPSFRRRIGRGGRIWLDRRNMPRPMTPEDDSDSDEGTSLTPLIKDRFRFDHDSDDDAVEDPNYVHREFVDPYDYRSMFLRAQNCPMNHGSGALAQHQAQLQRQRQMQQLQAQGYAMGQSQGQGQHPSQGQGQSQSPQALKKQAQAYLNAQGQLSGQTPQTLRQQVAAAQQQAAAAAQAIANSDHLPDHPMKNSDGSIIPAAPSSAAVDA